MPGLDKPTSDTDAWATGAAQPFDALNDGFVPDQVLNTSTGALTTRATFASGTTFTVPGNWVDWYPVGRRLKVVHAGGTSYGEVTAVSYSAPNTTVTLGNVTSGPASMTSPITSAAVGVISTGTAGNRPDHADLGGIGANDHHPQLHAAQHQPGGGDAMAVDAAAGTGSLRTLGTGGQQAAAGSHAHAALVDRQVFTASGTWTKPPGCTWVEVIAIGAGGGGGGAVGGAAGTLRWGAAGAGGGALVRRIFDPSALGATEAVTIGAGGAAGTGGVSGNGTPGGVGGSSSFGTHVTAYGGGGGSAPYPSSGGGGGGAGGAGNTGGTGGAPRTGAPATAPTGDRAGGSGATGGPAESTVGVDDVGNAEYGGGGGGGHLSSGVGQNGGSSLYGAPGGGGGGLVTAADVALASGAGGTINSYTPGGGGGAGSPGVAGTARSGTGTCGSGGGAGNANGAGAGFAGGAGGAPGAGGGAGGAGLTTGGAGAAGARGEVIVVVYF